MAAPDDLGTFNVYRGDEWLLPITDDDGGEPAVGTDLTGFGDTFTCQARASEDASPPITVTVDDSDAALGQLTLTIAAADTADMTVDLYVFDVQVTGGPLDPLTLYRGHLKMVKDVTHA